MQEAVRQLAQDADVDSHNVDKHLKLYYELRSLDDPESQEQLKTVRQEVLCLNPPLDFYQACLEEFASKERSEYNNEQGILLIKELLWLYPNIRAWEIAIPYILSMAPNPKEFFEKNLRQVQLWIPESHKAYNPYLKLLIEQNRESGGKQSSYVQEKFLERLRTPHADIDHTLDMFCEWALNERSESFDRLKEQATKLANTSRNAVEYRRVFEDRLLADPSAANYAEYIEWEKMRPKKWTSPAFVEQLYERAVADFPKSEDIWEDYLLFKWNAKGENKHAVGHIADRALRHLPNCTLFAARKLLIDELTGDPSVYSWANSYNQGTSNRELLTETLSQTLRRSDLCTEISEQLTTQMCDTLEERIDNICSNVEKAIIDEGPTDNMDFGLEWQLARVYQYIVKDSKAAQKMWQKVSQVHGHKTLFWSCWLEWEQYYSDTVTEPRHRVDNVIKFARAALNQDTEWPAVLAFQYLRHIRCQDDPILILNALKEVNEKLKAHAKRQSSVKTTPEQKPTSKTNQSSQPSVKNSEPKKAGTTDQGEPARNREHNTVIIAASDEQRGSGTSLKDTVTRALKDHDIDYVSYDESDSSEYAVVELSSHKAYTQALGVSTRQFSVYSGENTTLWVTNYPSESTKEQIEAMFAPYGIVISVRLPSSASSAEKKSERRFAYVQLSTADEAQNAIDNLDGQNGLVVKLSSPPPKKRRHQDISDTEVYIRGLDWALTQSDIETRLETECGPISRLKLPRGKNGKPHQGYGFVQFETSDGAEAALKLDQTRWNGRRLQVSLANSDSRQDQKHHDQAPLTKPEGQATPPATLSTSSFVPPALRKKRRL